MKKFIFDLITSPLSLFENPFYNYVAIAIIGFIAFKIAFYIVGEIGFRGEVGSIAHWTIRLIIFVIIWFACCLIISLITFIINNWIIITISAILLIIMYILYKYSQRYPSSILNKKIF